jgi:hypothetical protein
VQRYAEDDREEIAVARNELVSAVIEWREEYQNGKSLRIEESRGGCSIYCDVAGRRVNAWQLDGLEFAVYKACERAAGLTGIGRTTGAAVEKIAPIAESLCSEGLLLFLDNRYLALAVPQRTAEPHEIASRELVTLVP